MTLPEERTIIGALSPSRAGDFMTCPLLYRFRVIDQLPERPSPAAVRGTLVHAVLERLYDLPAAARTVAAARDLLEPEWRRLLAEEPEYAGLFATDEERDAWLARAREMIERYFTLEDPRRLEPAEREMYIEAVLDSGLLLRGYIDRLDVAPTGEVRIVDYKT
ncbi:MAG: PD-(D/E)XK nuclease family protein, partial [Actinomycetales bacterium]